MLTKVISGGQTGADQAGWRAAKICGLETGGWMPKFYKTETGLRPEFADLYGAKEHWSYKYEPRTKVNIKESNGTLLFCTNANSPGSRLTAWTCYEYGNLCVLPQVTIGTLSDEVRWRAIAEWIEQAGIKTLNVAGNRESKAPGIGDWVEHFLVGVFMELRARKERRDGK